MTITHRVDSAPQVAPDPRKQLTKREFKCSFTPAEFRAIHVFTATDDVIFQLWDITQTSEFVELDNEQTISGLNYIASLSTLENELPDAGRITEILAGI